MKQWTRIADWTQATERAEFIFTRWLEAGVLSTSDISRVFNAEYHYYVTFKSNKEVYGVIAGASSMNEAHSMARKVYGANEIAEIIVEWDFDPREFKGEHSRYSITSKVLDGNGEEVVLDQ